MQNTLADTGPLVSLFRKSDRNHLRSRDFIAAFNGNLITTWPVMTEVCHLLPPHAVTRFMAWAADGGLLVIEMPGETIVRLQALMGKYGDLPMDLADASLVWLGGQIDLLDVITLDERDFSAYRTAAGHRFRNLLAAA
ncbi:MAG: PIN domain-containing protein [Betaproteobacteria bacterium]|nr:PIN domain-containing protein [Betaproteobacteria bacterium]